MLIIFMVLLSSGAATAALPGASSDAGPGSRPASGPAGVGQTGPSGGEQGPTCQLACSMHSSLSLAPVSNTCSSSWCSAHACHLQGRHLQELLQLLLMPAAVTVHPLPVMVGHVPHDAMWLSVAWLVLGLVRLHDVNSTLLTCMLAKVL